MPNIIRALTVAMRPGVIYSVRPVATAPVRTQRIYAPPVGAQVRQRFAFVYVCKNVKHIVFEQCTTRTGGVNIIHGVSLALAVDRVTGFQTELSERIRGRRRARLTVWSPGGGH